MAGGPTVPRREGLAAPRARAGDPCGRRCRRGGRTAAAALAAALLLAACGDAEESEPTPLEPSATFFGGVDRKLARQVRQLAAQRGITPLPPPPHVRTDLARLGQMLLFDKELSGNRNISCMTCHLPRFGTGDARSLSIGEGATGLGPDRVHPDNVFIARNAPPLFNLAVLDHVFWDGRVEVDEGGRFHTPAGAQLTAEMEATFEFGAISALGLFPVTDRLEMRGQPGDNELADIPDGDFQGIWAAIMARLGRIREYRRLFERAYPGQDFDDMTFAHASNAMAGFLVQQLTLGLSPWDFFLAGLDAALTPEQLNGAFKFMNAPCSTCHTGPSFSDDQFHNVAIAQFGPGHGNGPSGRDDFGRMNVTGDAADLYRFRTTPLRNVALTAPYGHAGQFADLADFIDHYSQSDLKLLAYSDADIPDPLLRGTLIDNKQDIIDARSPIILGVQFDSVFVREVTAFMHALTDPRAPFLPLFLTPLRVPSGLPVDR